MAKQCSLPCLQRQQISPHRVLRNVGSSNRGTRPRRRVRLRRFVFPSSWAHRTVPRLIYFKPRKFLWLCEGKGYTLHTGMPWQILRFWVGCMRAGHKVAILTGKELDFGVGKNAKSGYKSSGLIVCARVMGHPLLVDWQQSDQGPRSYVPKSTHQSATFGQPQVSTQAPHSTTTQWNLISTHRPPTGSLANTKEGAQAMNGGPQTWI